MFDNQPDPSPLSARQQEADAFLKDRLGSPTASELLLATKIGDSDTPTVRWKFNIEALLMFAVAIREVLNAHGDDDPPFWELPIVTGFDEEDFRTLQQEITDILAAINS